MEFKEVCLNMIHFFLMLDNLLLHFTIVTVVAITKTPISSNVFRMIFAFSNKIYYGYVALSSKELLRFYFNKTLKFL